MGDITKRIRMLLDKAPFVKSLESLPSIGKKVASELSRVMSEELNKAAEKHTKESANKLIESYTKDAVKQASAARKHLDEVDKALKPNAANKDLLKQKQVYYKQAIEATTQKLEGQKKALEELQRRSDSDKTVEHQRYLKREIALTTAELKKLNQEYKPLFGDNVYLKAMQVQGVGKNIKSAGDRITKIGDQISVATKAVRTFAQEGVNMASSYETSAAKVQSILQANGDKTSNISKIKKEVMELSNESGVAAQSLMESTYAAISAGQSGANAVKLVGAAEKLATAGFTDNAHAIDVLTTAMNAYGKQAGSTEHIAAALIQTQNLGKVTVNELSQTMGSLIPVARMNGVAFNDIAAGYAALTKNGVQANRATVYMKQLFNELGKSGTKSAQAFSKATGKSFEDYLKGGKNVGQALQELQRYCDETGTKLGDLFGNANAKAAAGSLTQNIEDYNNALAQISNGANDKVLSQAYEKMMNTPEKRMERLKNSINNMKLTFGEALLPTIEPVMSRISAAVSKLSDAFTRLNPHFQTIVATAAAAVAFIGPLISGVGRLTSGLGGVLSLVGTTPGRIMGVVVMIGTVIGIIKSLISVTKKWKEAHGKGKIKVDTEIKTRVDTTNVSDKINQAAKTGKTQTAKVRITADTSGISKQLDLLNQDIKKVTENAKHIKAEIQTGKAMEQVQKIADSINKLESKDALISVDIVRSGEDPTELSTKVEKLSSKTVNVSIVVAEPGAKVTDVVKMYDKLKAEDVKVTVNTKGAEDKLSKISDAIKTIESKSAKVDVTITKSGEDPKKLADSLKDLTGRSPTVNVHIRQDGGDVNDIAKSLDKIKNKESKVTINTKGAENTLKGLATNIASIQSTKADINVNISKSGEDPTVIAGQVKTLESKTVNVNVVTNQTGGNVPKIEQSISRLSDKSVKISITTDYAKGKVDALKQAVSDCYTSITNKTANMKVDTADAKSKVADLKKYVTDVINNISKMKWKIPKPAVPKFHLSGEFDAKKGTVPSISVTWNKRAMQHGLILDSPTIVGMANGRLQGIGEAGPEVFAGAHSLADLVYHAAQQSTLDLVRNQGDYGYDYSQAILRGESPVLDYVDYSQEYLPPASKTTNGTNVGEIVFSPNVTINGGLGGDNNGNTEAERLMRELKALGPEFVDFIMDKLNERQEAAYA